MPKPELEEALEALDGVVYWTDLEGVVLGGSPGWNEFAVANAAPGLRLETVVGRNLDEFIHGEDVRRIYRDIHRVVAGMGRKRLTFTYRCDAPGMKREMRMTVGPWKRDGALRGVLYHSQIVYERERPPIALLGMDEALERFRDDGTPSVRMCGFCHAVKMPDRVRWIAVEDYYRLGGPAEVRLNHAVCPPCEQRLNRVVDIRLATGGAG